MVRLKRDLLGAPEGCTSVVFVDDINMPQVRECVLYTVYDCTLLLLLTHLPCTEAVPASVHK
jgi:hypothetical protein